MANATVTVDVDITLDEFDDNDLVEELQARGYTVLEEEVMEDFERSDLEYLLSLVDKSEQSWYTVRVRDKLLTAIYG